MSLVDLFQVGLEKLNRQQTALLGDRQNYIGASELSQCPRRITMQRKYPVQYPSEMLLRMERGHQCEDLLHKVFKAADAVYDRQVEIRHPVEPIRCHIDFLFYSDSNGKSCMNVLEVKSVASMPPDLRPRESWENQLYAIMGLLKERYPMGREIKGSIAAVNMNTGETRFWNSYTYDKASYNYLFSKAIHILSALDGQEKPRSEPSALCSFCDFRDDCPSFACDPVNLPDDVHQMLEQYSMLSDVKNKAEKDLKGLKEEIVEFTGPRFKGRSDGHSDNFVLNVTTVEGGSMVDTALLREVYPDIFQEVQKPKSPYCKIDVRPIKKVPQQMAA